MMEYRRKCNVCGKIYCYTDEDLKENSTNSTMAAISAIGAIASIWGGTKLDTYALDSKGDRYSDKVVDYTKCPSCNSSNTSIITEDEWNESNKKSESFTQVPVVGKRIEINSNATAESLLKRTKMFLEDEEWESAAAYCEQILDIEPECAMAYVYKLMVELRVSKQDKLANLSDTFYENKQYQKAIKFADDSLKTILEGYNLAITERNIEDRYFVALRDFENAKTEEDCKALISHFEALGTYKDSVQMIYRCEEKAIVCKYNNAIRLLNSAKTEKEFIDAKAEFDSISSYSDASLLSDRCKEKSEDARKNAIYDNAVNNARSPYIDDIENSVKEFEKIKGWRDADQKKIEAINQISQLKETRKKRENKKKKIMVFSIFIFTIVVCVVIIPLGKEYVRYKRAIEYMKEGKYTEAIDMFNMCNRDDIENYIAYCNTAIHVQNVPGGMQLSDLIAEIKALDNFNNADALIEKIPHIDGIKSKMNSWWKNQIKDSFDWHQYISITNNYRKRVVVCDDTGTIIGDYGSSICWDSIKQCWVDKDGYTEDEWFNNPEYSGTMYIKVSCHF